jgi:hypothetical protein
LIISHKHRFIFIKSHKTAGTSLELALSTICGENDVITPLNQRHETERTELGGLSPRNVDVALVRHRPRDLLLALRGKGRRAFWEHAGAEEVRAWVGPSIWNSYYKFSIERNPWDRAISLYWWRLRDQNPRPAMADFLRSAPQHAISNLHFYAIGREIVLDHVLRYERLGEELAQVAQELGINSSLELPHAKSNTRMDRRPYREVLGPEERSIIGTRCALEIDLLGYEF